MTVGEMLQALGLNPEVVVAGGLGGVLRSLSRKQFKFREAIAAPICGALAAAYLTLPAIHYGRWLNLPMPDEDAQTVLAAAFLIGTCAMWASDFIFEIIWRRFVPKQEQD